MLSVIIKLIECFFTAALKVSPPIGHMRLTVADASWEQANTISKPLILKPFRVAPTVSSSNGGPNHKVISIKTIRVIIPGKKKAINSAEIRD